MVSLRNAELLNKVVQEVAYTAPEGWKKLVYYREMLMDAELGLRNKSTARCWCGREMLLYPRSYEIGGSMEAIEAIEELYEDASKSGNEWKGMLLTIHEDGKYGTQFFYEGTPLLDGNSEKVNSIIAEAG